MSIKIPKPPIQPTRTEIWYKAHTAEEFDEFKKEYNRYFNQMTKWYKLLYQLK